MSNARTSLDLRITRELMDVFADLSGDRSSLHMDPAFGRRSMYGSNVVHGMLPLMFLPVLIRQLNPSGPLRISRIQGRFLKPLFPGDGIMISGTTEATGTGLKILFEVKRGDSLMTRGSISCGPAGTDVMPMDAAPGRMLTEHLSEADHRFEDIATGIRTTIAYLWGPEQAAACRDLITKGGHDGSVVNTVDIGAFGATALLSTLVGMRMPGRTATFQEFELDLARPLPPGPGRLSAVTAFRSAATNTITQDVELQVNDGPVARGKVSVHVAQAPFKPPTMEELAQGGTGFGLQDQVVLISGASRGIGAVTAKLFALHGARTVIDHRSSAAEAEAIVAEIRAHGGQAMAVQADVSDAEAVRAMIRTVEKAWGPVDVLVNNAAANFRPIPFLETSWDQVQADIDTIVKGAFNMAQAVIPGFLAKGGGRIVNLSTIAVETPPPQQTKYVLAKAALNGLTRSLAVEFADRNIRVNMVVPSFVETDLTSGHSRVAVNQMRAASPMKRISTARDVAEAILYLASPRSGFTTGQKLMVTGGLAPFL